MIKWPPVVVFPVTLAADGVELAPEPLSGEQSTSKIAEILEQKRQEQQHSVAGWMGGGKVLPLAIKSHAVKSHVKVEMSGPPQKRPKDLLQRIGSPPSIGQPSTAQPSKAQPSKAVKVPMSGPPQKRPKGSAGAQMPNEGLGLKIVFSIVYIQAI